MSVSDYHCVLFLLLTIPPSDSLCLPSYHMPSLNHSCPGQLSPQQRGVQRPVRTTLPVASTPIAMAISRPTRDTLAPRFLSPKPREELQLADTKPKYQSVILSSSLSTCIFPRSTWHYYNLCICFCGLLWMWNDSTRKKKNHTEVSIVAQISRHIIIITM